MNKTDLLAAVKELMNSGPRTVSTNERKLVDLVPKRVCRTCSHYPSNLRCPEKRIKILPVTPACNLYIVSEYFKEEAKRLMGELSIIRHPLI